MEANRKDFEKRQLNRRLAEAITNEYGCEAERRKAVKNDIIPYLITALIESNFDSSTNHAIQQQAQQEDISLMPDSRPITESPHGPISACYEVIGAKLEKKTRVLIRVNFKGKPLMEQGRNTLAGEKLDIEPFSQVVSECVRKLALGKLNYQSSFWRLRGAHNRQAA